MDGENTAEAPVAPAKKNKADRVPCPESKTSFLSKIFLAWVFPLVYKGWKTPLKDEDMWELRDFERASYTTDKLLSVCKEYVQKGVSRNVIAKSLFRSFRTPLIFTFFLKGPSAALKLTQPILLNKLIIYFQDACRSEVLVQKKNGLVSAISLLITSIEFTVTEKQYILFAHWAGMTVRSAVQGVIYEKSTRGVLSWTRMQSYFTYFIGNSPW